MIGLRWNPLRSAWGGAYTTAAAAQFATYALFNNTSYAEYLAVLDITVAFGSASRCFITLSQTPIGGANQPINSQIATETLPPGLFQYVSAVSNTFTNGYVASQATNTLWQWNHDRPFTIIPPGWSMVLQQTVAASTLGVSLSWEAIKPEDLYIRQWLDANSLPQGDN